MADTETERFLVLLYFIVFPLSSIFYRRSMKVNSTLIALFYTTTGILSKRSKKFRGIIKNRGIHEAFLVIMF